MIDYKIILVLTIIGALYFAFVFVDAKYNLHFVKWINGEIAHPFHFRQEYQAESESIAKENKTLKAQVEDLQKRVITLEKIVTEPAYELNKKINNL